jgi:Peptidase family S41
MLSKLPFFKTLIFIQLFLIASLSAIYAQKNTFTPEEIHADMAFLKKKFEKIHPGMYHYMSREAYNKIYDSLYNATTQPMSYMDAIKHIAPLIINLKDGHTSFGHKKGYFPKKTKTFPFVIRRLQDRFFISYNYSNDTTIIRASEILTINDEPLPQIIRKIRMLVSADNQNEASRDYYAINYFSTYFLKYYGETDSVKITYKLPQKDSLINKKLANLSSDQTMAAFNKRYKKQFGRNNLGYKIIDSTAKIALIDITSFSLSYGWWDVGQRKFSKMLRSNFTKLKNDGIKHLIMDFRGNGGGYIPNIAKVLKYIAPRNFTLVDTLAFKKKAYFTIFKPHFISLPSTAWLGFMKRKGDFMYRVNRRNGNNQITKGLHYDNDIYFLIDGGCYSATTFTLALAKDMGIGKAYIGEQVGGATWGSFAVQWQNFKLPNTRLRIHCPLMKINHRLQNPLKTSYLQPDYEVKRNYEELIKNNINIIDFTVDMIKSSGS